MKKLNFKSSSFFIVAMLAASVLTVGCNVNVEPEVPVKPSQTQFRFTAGIDQVTGAQTLASGIREMTFKASDEIGVYVVAYKKPTVAGKLEAEGNYVDNAKYVYDGSAWASTPLVYYPTVNVDTYAYWPYSSTFAPTATPEKYKVWVVADQSDVAKIGLNDFMTAQVVNQAPVTTPIAMKFYHRLAKADIKFTVPATYKGKAIGSVKSVKIKSMRSGAVVDLTTRYTYTVDGVETGGTYPKPAIANDTTSLIDITPNAVTAGSAPTINAQYEAIVVPQTQVANVDFIEIILQYQQGGGVEKFYYKAVSDIKFVASRSTVVNLTFQPDKTILLGTVDIQGWDTTLPDNGGELTGKDVFNDFTLSLLAPLASQITKVDLTIEQGTGTPTETVYTLPVVNTLGDLPMSFSFDGLSKAPEYYPYTVKKAECKAADGSVLATLYCNNHVVSATGAIALIGSATAPVLP